MLALFTSIDVEGNIAAVREDEEKVTDVDNGLDIVVESGYDDMPEVDAKVENVVRSWLELIALVDDAGHRKSKLAK